MNGGDAEAAVGDADVEEAGVGHDGGEVGGADDPLHGLSEEPVGVAVDEAAEARDDGAEVEVIDGAQAARGLGEIEIGDDAAWADDAGDLAEHAQRRGHIAR